MANKFDSDLFLHPSDKAALDALKAIPGFARLLKSFMLVWNEKQFKLINMSTNLKLGENQMAEYYNMLPPICEKLGIEVPELYVTMDVRPNAYTYGDTKPFIVMTTGLLDIMPKELIPTVLAHECGHIACHHTLYTTMAKMILGGGSSFLASLGNIAFYPIQLAFAYWLRCSEYSADRAAIICDGGADNTIELCMRYAGFKDDKNEAAVEAFLKQAEEYKEMVDDSKWNKTLEFLLFKDNSHPLNAVRAYEAREWAKTDRFKNIKAYMEAPDGAKDINLPGKLDPKDILGMEFINAEVKLKNEGFNNISAKRVSEGPSSAKPGDVVKLIINGDENPKADFYDRSAEIVLGYYVPKTDDELAKEHAGQIRIRKASSEYYGKPVGDVSFEFSSAGFENIKIKEQPMSILTRKDKEGTVAKITINGVSVFEKDYWVDPTVMIVIYKYVDKGNFLF